MFELGFDIGAGVPVESRREDSLVGRTARRTAFVNVRGRIYGSFVIINTYERSYGWAMRRRMQRGRAPVILPSRQRDARCATVLT